MFDLNKLGDMAKIASQAQAVQKKQEQFQNAQTDLMRRISDQLETVIKLLKERR